MRAWIEEGLVDSVVPKHYIRFNMEVPVEEFLELTSGTSIAVSPCLEQRMDVSDEQFRAAASRYWQAGVDSLYLYNFFNHRPHPLCQDDRRILREIGDSEGIRLRDKHYFLLPNARHDLADIPRQIPKKLDTRPGGHSISSDRGG